ncbi:MAG: SDR family oxidoreductase [Acidobacteria bacterium]|nr:SDR family oxidoreductase [Acidobacteriota bacterium]
MSSQLNERVALVTGGSRGIGLAVAKALLAEGASVVICARRQESLDEALDELRPLGRVEGRVCDVGRFAEVAELFQFMDETFGRIDFLINNAGVGRFAPIGEIDPATWDEVIATNLSGVFYCCHQAIPLMKKGGGGFIINIGSLAGKHAFAGASAYCASKFGLGGLSEAMMLDLRHDKIRVSTIMPGSVDTKFGGADRPAADWKIAPEHIAETVLHLLMMPERSLVSQVEMRPSRPPKK